MSDTITASPLAVGVLVYEGALLLNVAGPCEAFFLAGRELTRQQPAGRAAGGYRSVLLSPRGGLVRMSSGIEVQTLPVAAAGALGLDTIAVAGGWGIRSMTEDAALVEWLRVTAAATHRVAAFGSGAYLLAQAGLLQGRRCAVHWRIADDLQQRYPQVRVETGALFVQDGNCLTAAGASASIDLALKMIGDDFGALVAMLVARVMIISRMRTGEQPQLSAELRAQVAATPRVATVADWMIKNIDRKPSVAGMAERFAMSERNFSRMFVREVGISPRKFLEQIRIESARRWLVGSTLPIGQVAVRSGFSSGEHLAQNFKKLMGSTPSDYRALLRAQEADVG